jgi:hypothetical protein
LGIAIAPVAAILAEELVRAAPIYFVVVAVAVAIAVAVAVTGQLSW